MRKLVRLSEIGEAIALAGLKIGAIKITTIPDDDCLSAFLPHQEYRELIITGFKEIMNNDYRHNNEKALVIASMPTSYYYAVLLANECKLPSICIGDKPEKYVIENRVPEIKTVEELAGRAVVLIVNSFFSGKKSVETVATIQNAGGLCNFCLSILGYEPPHFKGMFAGEIPYNNDGDKLKSPCKTKSLLHYNKLLSVGMKQMNS